MLKSDYPGRDWRIHHARRFHEGKKVVELFRRQDFLTVSEEESNTICLNVIPLVRSKKIEFTIEDVPALASELNNWAALTLLKDKIKADHWLLKVRCATYDLLIIPAFPLWKVIHAFKHSKTQEPSNSICQKWELYGTEGNEEINPSPFPGSVLAQAMVPGQHRAKVGQQKEEKELSPLEHILREETDNIRKSVNELKILFKILGYERENRVRQSWILKLIPAESTENNLFQYVIEDGFSIRWRSSGQALYVKIDEKEIRLEAYCDLDIGDDRWYLNSSFLPLEFQVEVFEPRENPYSQQEHIIKRMFSKKHITEDCFAAAGTQMLLPTSIV
ncbi:MAG: hypothetical protein KAR13_14230 [Desulfobulbaceae bacterium]|nr:hypothetical protein [Desulfobulbaceae bacterium]